jgi:inner membrane protein
VALVGACAHRSLDSSFGIAFGFLFLATASHGVLDAFTNGGRGIAFFWPCSDERYFARYQLIEVAPLSVSHFLSVWGVRVIFSELRWVWLPCALLGIGLRIIFRQRARVLFRAVH